MVNECGLQRFTPRPDCQGQLVEPAQQSDVNIRNESNRKMPSPLGDTLEDSEVSHDQENNTAVGKGFRIPLITLDPSNAIIANIIAVDIGSNYVDA